MIGILILGIVLALCGIGLIPFVKLIFRKKEITVESTVIFGCVIFIILGIILIYISLSTGV